MHNKIKELRIHIGLSEVQISSLLNISSYKYKRYESGSLLVDVDILVLLSIMYDISIDLLIFDKFSVDVIFKDEAIKGLSKLTQKEKLCFLESNMCRYCAFNCNAISYRVVKNILAGFLNKFSKNLQNLRCSQLLEISEIASVLQSNVEYYTSLESGKVWPTVYDLIEISSIFSKPINEIIGFKNEAAI